MPIDVYQEWLGIPEGPRPPDHYALLRLVLFEDNAEKVRKNYKKLNGHVRKYATGQYSIQSQDLLNELAKAMLCLTDVERKREYDQSLGREIDDRDATTGRRPMMAYLQEEGVLSSDQVRETKAHAERTGLTIRDALVQLKYCDSETAARGLAMELGRPYVDLADTLPADDLLDLMPKQSVKRYQCLPLFEDDGAILVACVDDPGTELEDEIRLRYGRPLRLVIAGPPAINQAIAKYYAPGVRKEPAAVKQSMGSKALDNLADRMQGQPQAKLTDEQKQERKNQGIVIIALTLVVLMNLDNWVLWEAVYRRWGVPGQFPFVLTILLGGPIAWVIYNSHIKPRK